MPTPQATLLYRLQAIDSTLAKQRARIKAIDDTLGQNAEVQKARTERTQAVDRLSQLQTRTRALELENKSLTEKRNDAEKTLYGGHVTNPKELADLQHEVEALDRQRSKLEDDIVAV